MSGNGNIIEHDHDQDQVPDEDVEAGKGNDDDNVVAPERLWKALFMGNRQEADRIMRSLPPEVVRTLLENTGIDPAVLGVSARRTSAPAPRGQVRPQQPAPTPAAQPRRRVDPARVADLQFEDGEQFRQEEQVQEEPSTQELLNAVGNEVAAQLGGYPGVELGITFRPRGQVSLSAYYPGSAQNPPQVITRVAKAAPARLGDAIAGIFGRLDTLLDADDGDLDDEDDDGDQG